MRSGMQGLHIQNMLVPIDFSDNSMNALYTAVEIAKRHGATIKMLFVHDEGDDSNAENNLDPRQDQGIIKALGNLSKSIKDDENVACNFTYIRGALTNSIIQESVKMKADIIIIGKNGNAGHRTMFAGSCAYNVIKQTICPVLMVPGGKTWSQFNNILFPVRPTLSTLEKYAMLKQIIRMHNPTLHLLNLRNPSYLDELHVISKLVELLKIKLEKDKINFSLSYYFKDDKYAEKILAVVAGTKRQMDLLVMIADPKFDTMSFYLTLPEQQIIHQCNIPLLIMKAKTFKSSGENVLQELEKQLHYN